MAFGGQTHAEGNGEARKISHTGASEVRTISWAGCQFDDISETRHTCAGRCPVCNCHVALPMAPDGSLPVGGEMITPPHSTTSSRNYDGIRASENGDGMGSWNMRASEHALSIVNPIRAIMDTIKAVPCEGKDIISLGQGDPAIFGNLPPPPEAVAAVVEAVQSGKFNGYPHSAGLLACRAAVARHLDVLNARHLATSDSSTCCHTETSSPQESPYPPPKTGEDDVFVTVGASQALHICIAALANRGKNVLLPRPGFPLYGMLCAYERVETKFYDLRPDERWEADIAQVESLADENTVAIVVCNPSNPCGAVYSRVHLQALADVAERLRLVVIADEIYADMVFRGAGEFVPMAVAAAGRVPVLLTGGISKQWLVPGWRLGWAVIVDARDILGTAHVREAMMRLVQMTTGTSSIVQAAVPAILEHTPPEFFERTSLKLETSAQLCISRVGFIPGLACPAPPQGTMYIMVKIDTASFPSLRDDVHFAERLLQEEAVIILPGTAFGLSEWFRVVFAAPAIILNKAWDRIEAFCARHFKNNSLST